MSDPNAYDRRRAAEIRQRAASIQNVALRRQYLELAKIYEARAASAGAGARGRHDGDRRIDNP
ncbi:hypothetical protein PX554_09545 [Sphingomonas sp. H39-1-10]|uniref:hypothetical protein n=1 Tax=Sphingomonas TaxID=13687 RepID=UPI0015A301AF|nr:MULTISPECIES: hypothetical protein [Sphingomonas]MDF0488373.1 hypothetical protein [Sphingomonas pollutisoli]